MQEAKGIVAHTKGGPTDITTIVLPDPDPHDVSVKIQACGVCHTDMAYRDGGINDEYPFLLGHEAAGIVETVGAAVTHVEVGVFVILNGGVCGSVAPANEADPGTASTLTTPPPG